MRKGCSTLARIFALVVHSPNVHWSYRASVMRFRGPQLSFRRQRASGNTLGPTQTPINTGQTTDSNRFQPGTSQSPQRMWSFIANFIKFLEAAGNGHPRNPLQIGHESDVVPVSQQLSQLLLLSGPDLHEQPSSGTQHVRGLRDKAPINFKSGRAG